MFCQIFFPSGRRIVANSAPGVAPKNAIQSLKGAFDRSVHGDGNDIILGTGGIESAPAHGATDEMQRGRNDHLVDADKEDQDRIENFFHISVPASTGTFLRLWKHQVVAVQHPLPFFFQLFAGGVGGPVPCNQHKNMTGFDSVTNALRDSAEATANPVSGYCVSDFFCGDQSEADFFTQSLVGEKAENEEFPGERFALFANALEVAATDNSSAAGKFHPLHRDAAKTAKFGVSSVSAAGKYLATVLDGVTLVLQLCSLGNKTLASFLAATLDKVTTSFGRHASAETVLVFP